MNLHGRGSSPAPDHRRVHRATDPRVLGYAPALAETVENANQVEAASSVLLNRAGNHRRNPVLAGLGLEFSAALGLGDRLKGIYLFQRHSELGLNMLDQATLQAPGVYGLEILVGSGQTVAGTPATGAKRNYVKIVTARGSFERAFWAQSYSHDVVTLNDEAALAPETLQPVEVTAEIVDGSRAWLEVRVDFFTSWGDEFQHLHRALDPDAEAGYAKAYGGAAFVSFFDTTPGTEGVGTKVNPLTQVPIHTRRTIQVENTVGLKQITARFRSKQGSDYFVDVPLLIRVVDQDEVCLAPMTQPCTDLYVKAGSATPSGLPSTPSQPLVQPVAGSGLIAQDLLYATIRGATVGGTPKLRVRSWAWTASAPALAGARMVHLEDVDYLPFIQTAGTPETEEPYGAAKRYTVVLSVAELKADNVAFIELVLVDGTKPGMPVLIAGPRARDVQFFALGGTGGGVVCGPY
jgi:hypothetical protein